MDTDISALDMLIRLSIAAGLGACVGLERELLGKPAGLRSHTLVSVGSATFIIMGLTVLFGVADATNGVVQIDPTRIIQGVITGIGFLGAGSIIRNAGDVTGITTGASVWVAGSIGLAAGMGLFALAGMVTVMALIIISGLGQLEPYMAKWRKVPSSGQPVITDPDAPLRSAQEQSPQNEAHKSGAHKCSALKKRAHKKPSE